MKRQQRMRFVLALGFTLGLSLPTMAMSPLRTVDWKPPGYADMQQAYQNKALIERFYSAFARGDAKTMAACYHPEAQFYDPVFENLQGIEIGAMWYMLAEATRGTDFRVEFSQVKADANQGSAHWEAWYDFSATGNRVHNIIDAEFEFKEGLIYRHRDRFDFHRWSSMALGPLGGLLGGTALVQNQVRTRAQNRLKEFMDNRVWSQTTPIQ